MCGRRLSEKRRALFGVHVRVPHFEAGRSCAAPNDHRDGHRVLLPASATVQLPQNSVRPPVRNTALSG